MNFKCRDINNVELDLENGDLIILSDFHTILFDGKAYVLSILIKYIDEFGECGENVNSLIYDNLDNMYDDLIDLREMKKFYMTSTLGIELTKELEKAINSRKHIIRLSSAMKKAIKKGE